VYSGYVKPTISGVSETTGQIVEIITGDTVTILPAGVQYTSDAVLLRVSLASVKTPRMGNTYQNKPDEPYAQECKERLRGLAIGKSCKVTVDYERDIPFGPAKADGTPSTQKRKFATVFVGKNGKSLGCILLSEGLASVQQHREGDEKSSEYDALVAAETAARDGKKGLHSSAAAPSKKTNDLTDPKRAKEYVGFLQRSGSMKAVVDYVFSGSRFKLSIPSENCSVMFALSEVRTPNPSPNNPSGRAAEPFGDEAKLRAKLDVSQRNVEIIAEGCTNGGVITGRLHVGEGAKRTNFAHKLVSLGLATVDPRDVANSDGALVVALDAARERKIGLFALEKEDEAVVVRKEGGVPEEVKTVRVSEVKDGNTVFVNITGDDTLTKVEEKMAQFKETHGLAAGPVEMRKGKVIAAMFDDGSGMAWYRAKVVERPASDGSARVWFMDYGNSGKITNKQIRMLDAGIDTLPAAAKEVNLALVRCRPLTSDDGIDAARTLSRAVFGKELTLRVHGMEENRMQATIYEVDNSTSVNEQLVEAGLARCIGDRDAMIFGRNTQPESVAELLNGLKDKQDTARSKRIGIWIYGDVGEDDDESARY
jgi:staphylococcal nuclease domain-containing protein 1